MDAELKMLLQGGPHYAASSGIRLAYTGRTGPPVPTVELPPVGERLVLHLLPTQPACSLDPALEQELVDAFRRLTARERRPMWDSLARSAHLQASTLRALLGDIRDGHALQRDQGSARRLLLAFELGSQTGSSCSRAGFVDAVPAIEHFRSLTEVHPQDSPSSWVHDAGLERRALAAAIRNVQALRPRTMRTAAAHNLRALGGTRPFPSEANATAPANTVANIPDASLRIVWRAKALRALGRPLLTVAQAGGSDVRYLVDLIRTGCCTPETRAAVLAARNRLSHRPGPSSLARQHARSARWDPPLAWEEQAIGDASAEPIGSRYTMTSTWTPEALEAEIAFLAQLGLNWTDSLRRLGLGARRAHMLLEQLRRSQKTSCPHSPVPSSTDHGRTPAA
ncbi:hypothetical protein [Streptomyces sp. NPDC051572]|uniref:hypothetical protein n=1 Tax=Streptomyces sp. NPDC051572 TaxID=3155802 RepID=UPI00344F441B